MKYSEYVELIQEALKGYIPREDCYEGELMRAMKYSLLDGGKRIRPVLVLEFCRLCGGDVTSALPFACAAEMIHTYSLIHDDLPCMDDDSLRRGRPTNHIVYGEDMAVLAGDALLTLAFEVMLKEESVSPVGEQRAVRAASELAKATGAQGMVAGQVIDLKSQSREITLEILEDMYRKKTGAIITACAKMGCILAGASDTRVEAAARYAGAIGLAFQIVDDILDVTSTPEVLGKPIGSDAENGKCTCVSIMGIERSKSAVQDLTDVAIKLLCGFDGDTMFLKELAVQLATREK